MPPDEIAIASPLSETIRQAASRFYDNNRTVQSVLAVASTQPGFLDDPAIADTLSASDFTMLDLKRRKRKPVTVFLILPGRYIEAYSRFFRLTAQLAAFR
jgi:type IV secretion system protein VirD4